MAIDETGKWWKGEEFADLVRYVQLLTQEGSGADRVVQSHCSCGGTVFHLSADPDEGCAQRTCKACGTKSFIGDSADTWDDAKPKQVRCVCKSTELELGIGFALRPDGEIKWITVGQRCVKCGVLASSVDWGVDYAPSTHLLEMT